MTNVIPHPSKGDQRTNLNSKRLWTIQLTAPICHLVTFIYWDFKRKRHRLRTEVRFESSEEQPREVSKEKRAIYLPCCSDLETKYNIKTWDVIGIMIGTRGTNPRESLEVFRKLKVPDSTLDMISSTALNIYIKASPFNLSASHRAPQVSSAHDGEPEGELCGRRAAPLRQLLHEKPAADQEAGLQGVPQHPDLITAAHQLRPFLQPAAFPPRQRLQAAGLRVGELQGAPSVCHVQQPGQVRALQQPGIRTAQQVSASTPQNPECMCQSAALELNRSLELCRMSHPQIFDSRLDDKSFHIYSVFYFLPLYQLRKIFGAKRDEVTGEWRKLHNTELHALYSSPDIIRNIKSRRSRWAGYVTRMGESRNAYRVLLGGRREEDLWGGRDVDGKIILKWI
ncbi:hypothetical protein ANN_02424 [Periplaneta americana]|uniref:Uncharacterized protein n=1 Tax=Periplaneta americana TaxID=6978 RepID=A0ABQ8TWB7_PERAM|nr:hypothetical protein ANN_02424 [Periplaneta americana]